MANKEITELKEKIEIEKLKVEEAEELKNLNRELLRLQHKKTAKFADVAKDLPKMITAGLSGLIKVAGKAAEALNKMDEKVVAAQEKENKAKGIKKGKSEADFLMES